MFILTKISDLIQIKPRDFNKPSAEAIEDNINAKYANKVIQKIGLCICLYDLLSASEGLIGHGTGIVNVNVEFRLIVFRPFKHEVILGRISSSTIQGIKVYTGFFDDIIVPANMLPDGSFFDHNEQAWGWQVDGEIYYYDDHEWVLFKVEAERWVDQSPLGPNEAEEGVEKNSPYTIEASMVDAGLGPCLWWGEE